MGPGLFRMLEAGRPLTAPRTPVPTSDPTRGVYHVGDVISREHYKSFLLRRARFFTHSFQELQSEEVCAHNCWPLSVARLSPAPSSTSAPCFTPQPHHSPSRLTLHPSPFALNLQPSNLSLNILAHAPPFTLHPLPSSFIPHNTPHPLPTPHPSPLAPRPRPLPIAQASPIAPHLPPLTPHPSPLTPHPSLISSHPPPSGARGHLRLCQGPLLCARVVLRIAGLAALILILTSSTHHYATDPHA